MNAPTDPASPDVDSAGVWDRHADHFLGGAVLLVLLIGTLAYSAIEGWSLVDSFYFSSVALTVVGFGDLTPSSDFSKIFTVFYIFSGIAIIALWIQVRTKHRIVKHAEKHLPDAGATTPNPSVPASAEVPADPPADAGTSAGE